MVLAKLSNMIQEKKRKILRSLVAVSSQVLAWPSRLPHHSRGPRDTLLSLPQETQKPYEEMLVLKNWNIQRLKNSVVSFREVRAWGRPWPL